MKDKITAHKFLPKVRAICEKEIADCPIIDGLVFTGIDQNDLMEPTTAAIRSARHAAVYKITGEEHFRDYARNLLTYAGGSLITWKDFTFFPNNMPNWSGDGRTLRRAFYASRWIGDDTALTWIANIIRNWPYKEKEHKYVECLLAGHNAESSRRSFAYSLNMLLEAGLDAWLVGHAINDEKMEARGAEVIEQVIMPNQRDDGLWNYSAWHPGCDPYRLGTEEYNYSQYVAVMLSNLLEYPEWRNKLINPVQRSFEELCRRFELTGGAIYVPVHWGWDHVHETTLMNAHLAWSLYRYAGQVQYGELIARRLTWLEKADVGPDYPESLRHLYEMHDLWEMMADGLEVEGNLPDLSEVLPVLERMERELSIIPADEAHAHNYFSRRYNFSRLVLQRKIHVLRTEIAGGQPEKLAAYFGCSGTEIELQWRFGNRQMSTRIRAGWTKEELFMHIVVANPDHYQPYYGSQMDRGDSVSFIIQPEKAVEIRLTTALTLTGPQVFRYAEDAEFGQQRGWAKDYHEGDPLPGAKLEVYIHSGLVEYDLGLTWSSLGITPCSGLEIPLTIMVNKLTDAGFQFMVWGKDLRDRWTDEHKRLRLV